MLLTSRVCVCHVFMQMGEVMDNRYEVFASNGKGVFSVVVRARDQKRQDEQGNHPEVAIKLIRYACVCMCVCVCVPSVVCHRGCSCF